MDDDAGNIYLRHFRQVLPGLLSRCRGQWLLIDVTDRIVGTFPSEAKAREYARTMDQPNAFVKQILEQSPGKP